MNKSEIVNQFFERANENKDFDPHFQKKLYQHRRGTSFEFTTQNIWTSGDFADEEEDDKQVQKSQSIDILLPEIDLDNQSQAEMLTKQEKKQIKRDLKEFAKSIKGGTKGNVHRKNLIEIEEAKEDRICKGSQASEFIKEHKKNKTKKKKVQQPSSETSQPQPIQAHNTNTNTITTTSSTNDKKDDTHDSQSKDAKEDKDKAACDDDDTSQRASVKSQSAKDVVGSLV